MARSMTDTRTPDARLREQIAKAIASYDGPPDLMLPVHPSATHARKVRIDAVAAHVAAALTGDADTPEPGLDVGRLARAITAAWGSMDYEDDWFDEDDDGWPKSDVMAGQIAAEYARLATHPVEAPQ